MFTAGGGRYASVFVGYYHDAFRRENGVWLYTARRFYTYSPVLDLSGG